MSGPGTDPPGPRRSIRVCLVAPSLDILGGQAVAARRLQERLAGLPGIEVELLPVNPRLPGILRLLQRVKYVRTLATSVAYITALLRQARRFDVLHVFSASYWSFLLAPTPAIMIGRLLGRKVVLNYRSGEAEDHLRRFGWHAIPILRLAHTIVTPSEYLVHVFSRFGLPAVAVHNFVEVDRIPFRVREQPAPSYLANRNFEPLYNVHAVVDAFAMVAEVHPGASLVLAGDGSQRVALEDRVRELGLRNVTFVGRVPPDRMPALYDDADVYVNASVIDNMPQSIVEAYAAGVPVVSSDAGGIPFIADSGATALLVPAGDTAALGAAMRRMVEEEGLARRLSAAGRERCLTYYTWEAVAQQWLALYRNLVK